MQTYDPARTVNRELLRAEVAMEKVAGPMWKAPKAPAQVVSEMPQTEEPLQPYQSRVVRRISAPNQPGLVVAHSTGTGKTRTSLEAYKHLGMPTNVIVPAALRANYQKEQARWAPNQTTPLDIDSQQAVARQGLIHDKRNGLQIVDEAHRAREGSSQLLNALKDSQAKKRLLLTATPIFNHPKDLATLVNLAANKSVLPENESDFNARYIKQTPVQPNIFQRLFGIKPGLKPEVQNSDELGKILNKYVDYQGPSTENYPSHTEETVKVPMGQNQMDVYKTIMGRAPMWVRWKVKSGLPPGKGELESMRAFMSGARQVSNTNQGFVKDPRKVESTKIQNAFNYFQRQTQMDPTYKGVIYSNYLNSGLDPYKQYLDKAHIPYGEYSGDIKQRIRNDLVKQYNENKLKALLISSAGSEGLDLKGTRLVQILEPHFNEEKEKQIIGRAIRYKSHEGLPPDKQNVLIQRYLAQPRASFLDRITGSSEPKGTDEYIRNMATEKTVLTNKIMELLQQR